MHTFSVSGSLGPPERGVRRRARVGRLMWCSPVALRARLMPGLALSGMGTLVGMPAGVAALPGRWALRQGTPPVGAQGFEARTRPGCPICRCHRRTCRESSRQCRTPSWRTERHPCLPGTPRLPGPSPLHPGRVGHHRRGRDDSVVLPGVLALVCARRGWSCAPGRSFRLPGPRVVARDRVLRGVGSRACRRAARPETERPVRRGRRADAGPPGCVARDTMAAHHGEPRQRAPGAARRPRTRNDATHRGECPPSLPRGDTPEGRAVPGKPHATRGCHSLPTLPLARLAKSHGPRQPGLGGRRCGTMPRQDGSQAGVPGFCALSPDFSRRPEGAPDCPARLSQTVDPLRRAESPGCLPG